MRVKRFWQRPLHWLLHDKDGYKNNYRSYWFCHWCCDIRIATYNASRQP